MTPTTEEGRYWQREWSNERGGRIKADARIATLERELAESKAREEEGDAVCQKLSALLARVAIALKGEPPDMTLWSFHDLPELVATLAIENAILKEQKGDTNADV